MIWKLPNRFLNVFIFFQIIHLKRFQQLNNRWIKSNKIVKFPMRKFDPSSYLVERDRRKRNPSQRTCAKILNVRSTNECPVCISSIPFLVSTLNWKISKFLINCFIPILGCWKYKFLRAWPTVMRKIYLNCHHCYVFIFTFGKGFMPKMSMKMSSKE